MQLKYVLDTLRNVSQTFLGVVSDATYDKLTTDLNTCIELSFGFWDQYCSVRKRC
jgi:hypothetical protein